jgi:hypothetical protein
MAEAKVEYVDVTIRLTRRAIATLGANVNLKCDDGEIPASRADVLASLGWTVYHEARGTHIGEAYNRAPIDWRGEILVVESTRKTYDKQMNVLSDDSTGIQESTPGTVAAPEGAR